MCIRDREKKAVKIVKKEGKLDKLKSRTEEEVFYGRTGIGHTRWLLMVDHLI